VRKLLLALGLLALAFIPGAEAQGPIVGPGQPILCPFSFQTNVTSATTTQLIAGNTSQRIYICGWHVTSILATSTTFQFTYGTGATCTTANTGNLTPPFNVTSTAPSADHGTYASLQVPPTGNPTGANVCMVTGTGTTGTAVIVYYSIF
jgi:hypothetical protein